ncbi:alpha-amylase family glycosyl hydrolase [Halobacillus kuroshimensis]|uniref:alpha-amylase family glycosyl hydrolase n=1 Tax=Halobacillus kuroshimensis TaxID=302481 RepID=UPI0004155217|nr:alpha-amylase family glycosyl hydrolase [Halobacillus kuroshimensis]
MKKAAGILLLLPFFLLNSMVSTAGEGEERRWQDESVYYIAVDRFFNSDRSNDEQVDVEDPQAYQGGDFAGLTSQLDYIEELGFTTIQLSPVMANAPGGFHGFWVTDFRSVEEQYGTMEEMRAFVQEAHDRDLRVVLDLPLFTAAEHPWLKDETKSSWLKEGVTEAPVSWLDDLPQLNMDNKETAAYIKETMNFWMEEAEVDGFHLVSQTGLEMTEDLDDILYTTSVADSKEFSQPLRDVFAAPGAVKGKAVDNSGETVVQHLDGPFTGRFTHEAVENGQNPITRWRLGLTYIFTTPGLPVVYYGSETPLDDGGNPEAAPMINVKAGNEELKQRVEKLTSMREQYPAITRGDYEELYNDNGLIVFERSDEEESLIVAINNASETKTAELDHLDSGLQLRGLLQDGVVREQSDGTYRLAMDRETADVFIMEEDSGYNWLFIGFVGGVLLLFTVAVIILSRKSRSSEKA